MERKQDYNMTSEKMLKFAFKDVSTKNSVNLPTEPYFL
jgi:hypothetical protein